MSILERIKQIIKKNKTAQNQIIIKEISKKIAQKEINRENQAVIPENKHVEKRQNGRNIKSKAKSRHSKSLSLIHI